MKNVFYVFILLFAAISASSQVPQPKKFLEVFNNLRTHDNKEIKCDYKSDDIQRRILFEYGAVYISQNAKLPPTCRFTNETQIAEFTKQFRKPENKFGFGEFYLQEKAKESLQLIFDKFDNYKNVARNCNGTTSCTDLINDDWALRTYAQTQINWGRPYKTPILPIIQDNDKFPEIFSHAIPGGSQHHLGLAIDINKGDIRVKGNVCDKDCVTEAFEEKGWFRTVKYDAYHFTYLSYTERENLEGNGLKKVRCGDGFDYWVPNVDVSDYKIYNKDDCR